MPIQATPHHGHRTAPPHEIFEFILGYQPSPCDPLGILLFLTFLRLSDLRVHTFTSPTFDTITTNDKICLVSRTICEVQGDSTLILLVYAHVFDLAFPLCGKAKLYYYLTISQQMIKMTYVFRDKLDELVEKIGPEIQFDREPACSNTACLIFGYRTDAHFLCRRLDP